MMGVGSSGGEDGTLIILLESLREHGTRLASLEVEEKLVIETRVVGVSQGLIEVIGVQVRADRHGNKTNRAVIGVVDEDTVTVSLGGLKNTSRTTADSRGITTDDSENVGSSAVSAGVVNHDIMVHVLTTRLVDDDSGGGVTGVVGNIILLEGDDALCDRGVR